MASALSDVEFFERAEQAFRTLASVRGHTCAARVRATWPCPACAYERLADEAADRALVAREQPRKAVA